MNCRYLTPSRSYLAKEIRKALSQNLIFIGSFTQNLIYLLEVIPIKSESHPARWQTQKTEIQTAKQTNETRIKHYE